MSTKRYYRLHIYRDTEYPMPDILRAVEQGYPKMKYEKKYTLKQIVELGELGLWATLKSHYIRRCVGASFAAKYYKDEIYDVMMFDPEKSPIKYVRV